MGRARTERVPYGRSGTSVRRSLRAAAGLFAGFALGSVAYHALVGRLVDEWPRTSRWSTVDLGVVRVPYDALSSWVLLGVAVAGLAGAATVAARRRGLLASLLSGIAPPLGYLIGGGAHFRLVFADSLGALFDPVPFGLLVGVVPGVAGYLVGRGARALVTSAGGERG